MADAALEQFQSKIDANFQAAFPHPDKKFSGVNFSQ